MGPKIPSSCPPMTLREREALDAIQLEFLILPLPRIFKASATHVLNQAVSLLGLVYALIDRITSC
jgi:hypothetical protein